MKNLILISLVLLCSYASAWELTQSQKSLLYVVDENGAPVGNETAESNMAAMMNQCHVYPRSFHIGQWIAEAFVASSGVGFGNYACSIEKELAEKKGYKLADLPSAVYGKLLKCVVRNHKVVDFEISEAVEAEYPLMIKTSISSKFGCDPSDSSR